MKNTTWGIGALSASIIAVALGACSSDEQRSETMPAVINGIDFGECFACGDNACPTEASNCDGIDGCRDLLNCAFSCQPGDIACTQACIPSADAQRLAQAASAYPAYLTCAITSCLSECSATTTGTGTAGAGATGSAGASGTTPSAGALTIGATGDYISSADNVYGIQGSFYAYSDCDTNGDGVDDPASFSAFSCTSGWTLNTANPGMVCISGTVGVREDMTNYTDWGAGLGVNLNEQMPAAGAAEGTPRPYNASAAGVTGFSFELVAPPGGTISVPSNTVVEFPNPSHVDGEEHNASVKAGLNTIAFSSLKQPSWATMKASFDPAQIIAMKWKVESQTSTSNTVNFCVTNITPLK